MGGKKRSDGSPGANSPLPQHTNAYGAFSVCVCVCVCVGGGGGGGGGVLTLQIH